MKRPLFLLLCILLLTSSLAQGQRRTKVYRPGEVARMPIVLIDLLEKSYPRSHLEKVNNSSIVIVNRSIHRHTLRPMYFSGDVSFDQISRITIISQKRKWKTNLIGAAIGGAAGYLVGRQLRPDRIRRANIELISQPAQNGFIEPILGGILGAGLGAVIGDLFTPISIEQVNENPREAAKTLRTYLPNKKKKKRKGR